MENHIPTSPKLALWGRQDGGSRRRRPFNPKLALWLLPVATLPLTQGSLFLDLHHYRLVWSLFKFYLMGDVLCSLLCLASSAQNSWWDSSVCRSGCRCFVLPAVSLCGWTMMHFSILLLMAHSDSSKWCCSMTVLTDVLWGSYVHILKWHHKVHCLLQ